MSGVDNGQVEAPSGVAAGAAVAEAPTTPTAVAPTTEARGVATAESIREAASSQTDTVTTGSPEVNVPASHDDMAPPSYQPATEAVESVGGTITPVKKPFSLLKPGTWFQK